MTIGFSHSELSRGVLRWNSSLADAFVDRSGILRAITENGKVDHEIVWGVLPFRLEETDCLEFRFKRPITRLETFAWHDRLEESEILLTDLFEADSLSMRKVRLAYAPDAGYFHRLLVRVSKVAFSESRYYMMGRNRVGLLKGRAGGPSVGGVVEETIEGDKHNAVVDLRLGALEGDFIDVTANGKDPDTARTRALGVLGFLSLWVGDAAVDDVVVDASISAIRSEPFDYQITNIPKLGFILEFEAGDVEYLMSTLETVLISENSDTSLGALAQYGHAANTMDISRRLSSLMTGIEILLDHNFRHNHQRESEKWKGIQKEVVAALSGANIEDIDTVISRVQSVIGRPSLKRMFDVFASDHHLSDEIKTQFKRSVNPRNDLLHKGKDGGVWKVLDDTRSAFLEIARQSDGLSRIPKYPRKRDFMTVIRSPFGDEMGWPGELARKQSNQ